MEDRARHSVRAAASQLPDGAHGVTLPTSPFALSTLFGTPQALMKRAKTNPQAMIAEADLSPLVRRPHRQMLKLVARSFYKELVNYGVNTGEVLTVAAHLLDNVLQSRDAISNGAESYNGLFTIDDIRDEWTPDRRLALHRVSITPMQAGHISKVAGWLQTPAIRDSFYPMFPQTVEALREYLSRENRSYFCIMYEDKQAGMIGAENLDHGAGKLEMRKFVGDPELHGKGIGKRATFLFLYYSFLILKFNKVWLHSMDMNIRNLNLNSKFGFDLEGVFLEEAVLGAGRQNVVRMGLLKAAWLEMFSAAGRVPELQSASGLAQL